MPSFSFYERQHLEKLIQQEASLKNIFDEFVRAVSILMSGWKDSGNENVWLRNATIEKGVEKELQILHDKLVENIKNYSIDAWNRSNRKTDDLIEAYIKDMPLNEVTKKGLFARNEQALEAFLKAKIDGETISDRVWKVTGGGKEAIEHYLSSGISTGRPAALISQDMRQLLKEPDKRFRRIRNEQGKLVMSTPMKNYHPGTGVYRSSFMNAKRLAVSRTNASYRTADCYRWEKLDFVLGIDIRRSAFNKGPCPICDSMVGSYPKNYKYRGWHPFCICPATPILMDADKFINSLVGGTVPESEFIQDIPIGAREYIEDKLRNNKVSINSYLFQNNKRYFLNFVEKPENLSKATKSLKLNSDITGFVSSIEAIVNAAQKSIARREIIKLKSDKELIIQFTNPSSGRQILKHSFTEPLDHEFVTAKKLTDVDFDVIFAPKSMFRRNEKKFDVFLLTDDLLIKADLKTNYTPTSNAIFKSIESGNGQAPNIVIDINSKIKKTELIDGLRNGLKEFRKVKNVRLFFKKKYFPLDRDKIFSKEIYKLLK